MNHDGSWFRKNPYARMGMDSWLPLPVWEWIAVVHGCQHKEPWVEGHLWNPVSRTFSITTYIPIPVRYYSTATVQRLRLPVHAGFRSFFLIAEPNSNDISFGSKNSFIALDMSEKDIVETLFVINEVTGELISIIVHNEMGIMEANPVDELAKVFH